MITEAQAFAISQGDFETRDLVLTDLETRVRKRLSKVLRFHHQALDDAVQNFLLRAMRLFNKYDPKNGNLEKLVWKYGMRYVRLQYARRFSNFFQSKNTVLMIIRYRRAAEAMGCGKAPNHEQHEEIVDQLGYSEPVGKMLYQAAYGRWISPDEADAGEHHQFNEDGFQYMVSLLDKDHADVILDTYLRGLSQEAICKKRHISRATLNRRLFSAKNTIRQEIRNG